MTQEAKQAEAAKTAVTAKVQEGSSAQRCTYMELAMLLGPGLPPAAVKVLYTAAKPSLQVARSKAET